MVLAFLLILAPSSAHAEGWGGEVRPLIPAQAGGDRPSKGLVAAAPLIGFSSPNSQKITPVSWRDMASEDGDEKATKQSHTIQSAGSLFAGRVGGSFFAKLPEPVVSETPYAIPRDSMAKGTLDKLRDIIGHAESRREGYDAINYGATRRTPKRPTAMTIGEIIDWIEATPGQPHAIGRYQFIPETLRRLVAQLGVPKQARFTPDLQDFLSDQLLREAGILAVQQGRMTRRDFMLNLSKIWAGLPTPTGNSYYEGYAGNTATITWAEFDRAIAGAFPARLAQNEVLK